MLKLIFLRASCFFCFSLPTFDEFAFQRLHKCYALDRPDYEIIVPKRMHIVGRVGVSIPHKRFLYQYLTKAATLPSL